MKIAALLISTPRLDLNDNVYVQAVQKTEEPNCKIYFTVSKCTEVREEAFC